MYYVYEHTYHNWKISVYYKNHRVEQFILKDLQNGSIHGETIPKKQNFIVPNDLPGKQQLAESFIKSYFLQKSLENVCG